MDLKVYPVCSLRSQTSFTASVFRMKLSGGWADTQPESASEGQKGAERNRRAYRTSLHERGHGGRVTASPDLSQSSIPLSTRI